MALSPQDATAQAIDILVQAGTNKLSLDEANKVKEATDALGHTDVVDVTRPASVILANLRPFLVSQIGQLANNLEQRAVNSVEGLDDKYGKETMMTLWPHFGHGVKTIIFLLVAATVVVTGYLAHYITTLPETDMMDAAVVGLVPLFALSAFCTWPIKTLAYSSLTIAAKVVEVKMQKTAEKQAAEKQPADQKPAEDKK